MIIDDQVTVRDEAKRILSEARDAIREIESEIDRINQLMVELLLSGGLSEEGEMLADSLGGEANALFAALDRRFEELRREIVAATGDDDGEDEAD